MSSLHQPREGTRPAGSRAAIETLAWLIEDAFPGDPSHSLLANLRDLRDDDWTALPPGGGRSIAGILGLVAGLLGFGRPKVAVAENLQKLKQLLETGEVVLQEGRLVRL